MVANVITQTSLNFPKRQGKVRDIYDLGDSLLMISTDRISAFDCVLPNGIPYKGICLNQLSLFWFDKMKDIIDNHIITGNFDEFPDELKEHSELKGRSVIVKKAKPIPIECIVRGYLTGSAWRDYKKTGKVYGIDIPKNMKESERFPEPLFTPTTKAESGHDEPISFEQMRAIVGEEIADILKSKSLEIYKKANEYAESRGILIPDTKFEFGLLGDKVILIDELLTPDSSRFWYAKDYEPGKPIKQMDKEYVRRYLMSVDWNKEPPAPALPEKVVEETSRRYLEIFRAITGKDLDV